MKRITMVILFMVCALGYSQHEAKSMGVNNPIYYNQQQKKKAVVTSNISDSPSEITKMKQGENNPVVYQKQQTIYQGTSEGRSATSLDDVAPVQRNLSGPMSLSASNNSLRTVIGPPPGTASRNMHPVSYYNNMAPVTITHSVTQNIVAGNSVTCNAGGIPDENSFFRDFDLAADFGITDAFNVSSAEFAVEAVSGPTNLTINIYSTTTAFPGGYPGSATLQGTANYVSNVADAGNVVSVPITATIPAGSIMIYELKINAGATASWFPGSNADGQTGVSWIMSAACSISTPTDLAAIGFPNQHMVMNIVGEEAGGGGPFPDPYCGPLDFTSNVEPITLVEVAGISNVTDATVNGTPDHEDFTAISGDMEAGMSYPIALEGNTDGNFTNRFVVFIDWNQNGILNDAGEVYEITDLLINSTGTDGQQSNGTIDVPAGAMAGTTRMRVKKQFGMTNYLDPCLATGFGQAEDYSMNVTIGGGGTGGPCATTGPSNGFENGKSFTKNLGRIVANDITVVDGEDMLLESITFSAFIGATGSGVNADNVDVFIYEDNGSGAPGALLTSQTSLVPDSQVVIGTNFGFDVWSVELDITDVNLPGQSGAATTYWIGLSLEPTDGSNTFWENSTAGLIGYGEAYDDGLGGGFVIDGTLEGVYSFDGTCSPIGGGGSPCATTGPSNGLENGKSFTKNLGRIVANDITVVDGEDMLLESITFSAFIGATGSGVNADNVDVFIYEDNGSGAPGALLTSQTNLVPDSQVVIGTNFGFDVWSVELDITDVNLPGQSGAATTYWIGLSLEPTDGSNTFWENSTAGLIGFGEAYDDGLGGGFVIDGTLEGVYSFDGTCSPIGGGSTYDDCAGAIALACGDSVVGETLTATDSGGNPAPDVFYKFTGSGAPQLVTISLCGGGTDYDSALRVFDDCDLLNELAFNDDSCGLQSEVSFTSDGTSTYYIMVEGFGSASGNFSLDVTCEDPLPNDDCSGAIAVSCGSSVTGSTVDATIDSSAPACGPAITSPGVWYSLNDNSGLPGDITLSLCNGTDFDSKISVYSGTCAALVCVDGNDDACGLQSEVTFASDGNTQYYILIHSFGGATGNFTLDVTCTPTPPPNDMIVNSIDVDEIGFPYTDPAVAMPAATLENGNPVNCDLTGARGVWYNFVPAGDGTANATIVTPGGASSVTFYTAPNENAVETDLTLVPQQTNQCAPGTSASIFTLGGQAYYVFVMNTGAITDIVIDGTNLGVSDNTIAGFSYYPNPTNGILNLNSVDNIEHVSLYNLLGQVVIDNRVNATASQVDITGLSAGTYLMKVTVNGKTGTYKVLKQ
ncbi:T9SS type A sorting domain-containing protein [Aequorivita todarodis]|uniref:T9SS type A sorting domain-containing protein n=1 Tax=Aequorivita todarodis TaxID=2036821 RepID=UPI002350766B|nr:T9SS type A sorting domain-containing protein [Aequorivita todarodis]MDC8000338.1 T9SS type A sorting domain-containing protein [Aequorivita todarodis]